MTNFDFLRSTPDFASFSDVAISAERLLHIDVDAYIWGQIIKIKRALKSSKH